MSRTLILGTAGHIDHGKTALVKALTGTDTDRLPEEKSRGITIDIGFARLDMGDVQLGVVDVPGHERFVRNMLAGATGIDLALLVVAADDAVMPQTREHLDILQLLGLTRGVIAITKADLADAAARELVETEVRELVQGTFLESAPIIPTSAHTGAGIAELKEALAVAARDTRPRARGLPFRLPIDRAFVAQGFGTVVTGSVVSGAVRVGDELDWHRGDGTIERVRVRGLNRHGASAEEAGRGQRAAVNLAGVPHDAVRRGQELATVVYLVPSRVISVRLRSVGGRVIRHRLPVRLHVGTAEVMGTVSVLDFDRVEPGRPALAQLFLDEPVTTVWGQPFVVRDSSAEHTLGGGQVLQPTAIKLRRRHLDSLERLEKLETGDVASAAWFAGFAGLNPAELPRLAGVPADTASVPALIAAGTVVEISVPPTRRTLLHAERVAELERRILAVLAELHAAQPLLTTHDRNAVAARVEYIGDDTLVHAVIDRAILGKRLVGDARRIARADFKPKLTANQRKLKDKIVEQHRVAGFAPPEPASFANQAAGNSAALTDIYEVAAAEGFLVKVAPDVYLHAETDAELRRRIAERLASGPGMTVAEIRDLLGTTRKFAIPVCEYLDRIGLTRRAGDVRVGG